jgi:hypothetical protein
LQSLCRKALDLEDAEKYTPFDCGHSAYRFLVPKEQVMADPVCREFVEQEGMLCMIVGEDRRVVVYPCVENKLMNFLLVRTATQYSRASTDFFRHRFTQAANRARMMLAGTNKVTRSVCLQAVPVLHLKFVLS